MDSIPTVVILDLGSACVHSYHPDALAKRTALAQVLVTARCVRSIDAGILLFRIWAVPASKIHPLETLFRLANDKAAER